MTSSTYVGYTASNGYSQSIIFMSDQQIHTGASISITSITQSEIDLIKTNDTKLYDILTLDSNKGFEYYGQKYELNGNKYYRFLYYKWDSTLNMFVQSKGINWTSETSKAKQGHIVKGFYTDYYSTNNQGFGHK